MSGDPGPFMIWHRHRWLGWIVRYPDGKRRWCLREATADRLVDTYMWPSEEKR